MPDATTVNTSRDDLQLISQIAKRAIHGGFLPPGEKLIDFMLDIEYTHAETPLKLAELLDADPGNFAHDIHGIYEHLDRNTKKLGGCFLPRYAV